MYGPNNRHDKNRNFTVHYYKNPEFNNITTTTVTDIQPLDLKYYQHVNWAEIKASLNRNEILRRRQRRNLDNGG